MKKTLAALILSLAGCTYVPPYEQRTDPVRTFDTWFEHATVVGRVETFYLDHGLVLQGPHPRFTHKMLYVLALDSNGTGSLEHPSKGDDWCSSMNKDCIRYWQNISPVAEPEDPPYGWDEWEISQNTLKQINEIYHKPAADIAQKK